MRSYFFITSTTQKEITKYNGIKKVSSKLDRDGIYMILSVTMDLNLFFSLIEERDMRGRFLHGWIRGTTLERMTGVNRENFHTEKKSYISGVERLFADIMAEDGENEELFYDYYMITEKRMGEEHKEKIGQQDFINYLNMTLLTTNHILPFSEVRPTLIDLFVESLKETTRLDLIKGVENESFMERVIIDFLLKSNRYYKSVDIEKFLKKVAISKGRRRR